MHRAVIRDWIVPFMDTFRQKRFKGLETRGIDAQDYVLMWVVQDCAKCSARDRKIAQYILDQRLIELEDLF